MRECPAPECRHCRKKHHASICYGRNQGDRPLTGSNAQQSRVYINKVGQSDAQLKKTKVNMWNTKVSVFNEDRKCMENLVTLLDTASEATIISEEAVNKLGLKTILQDDSQFIGLGGQNSPREMREIVGASLYDVKGNIVKIAA